MNQNNSQLRLSLQNLLSNKSDQLKTPNVIALSGVRFLGQKSLAKDVLLAELHESDFIEMKSGIDGAREIIEFSETEPINSPFKAVLVDNADRLLEPAQDALLRLLESPPKLFSIILITYDTGLLQPSLSSRIRAELKFFPISNEEMREYASSLLIPLSDNAINMSCGRSELYKLIVETGGFEELYDSIISITNHKSSFISKPPKILLDLESGDSQIRDAVIHVIRYSCKSFFHNSSTVVPILKFCGVLSSSTSANVELHWMRAVSASLV